MNSPTIRRALFTPLLLAALLLSSCATLQVKSYVVRGVDLNRYRSYSWGPARTVPTGDPRLDNNTFFEERVRAQVDKALEGRGFAKTAAAGPDVLVHYHLSVAQEVDVRQLDTRNSYCATEDCRPFVYDKGTLFIDLVEPGTERLIWRGWAEGSLDGVVDNQAWLEARIDETVAKILGRLPSRLRTPGQ